MKSYKMLKEDIGGMTTGAGIAMYNPMLGGTGREPPMRRRSVYESLGICEDCVAAMVLKDGVMTCPKCNKPLKETY